MMPLKLEHGKEYLAIRCANPACRHDLPYAEITALEPGGWKSLEREFRGQIMDCLDCNTQTLVFGTIAILAR